MEIGIYEKRILEFLLHDLNEINEIKEISEINETRVINEILELQGTE